MDENNERPHILVVEDETHLAAGLKLNLELEGYHVQIAGTGRQALAALVRPEGFAAIILDVMLPDFSGFEICKKLRQSGDFTPVLMLTARDRSEDRVTGLELGADDYLPKPFELNELLARLNSLLRRRRWDRPQGHTSEMHVLRFGDATINFDTHEAQVGDRPIHLTQLEFDLLRYFAGNAGRVLHRDELLEKVWKLAGYPNTRTVDNFIARLRRHFEANPKKPKHFLSVRGSGYKFEPS